MATHFTWNDLFLSSLSKITHMTPVFCHSRVPSNSPFLPLATDVLRRCNDLIVHDTTYNGSTICTPLCSFISLQSSSYQTNCQFTVIPMGWKTPQRTITHWFSGGAIIAETLAPSASSASAKKGSNSSPIAPSCPSSLPVLGDPWSFSFGIIIPVAGPTLTNSAILASTQPLSRKTYLIYMFAITSHEHFLFRDFEEKYTHRVTKAKKFKN